MTTQVNPQEIYLLERFSSLAFFGELRDTWEEMVKHIEACLESFMHDLNPRYRSTPLPEQPDIAWGTRVIPNFRSTLQGLYEGYVMLSHGDVRGLAYASGPRGDFKGQMDYSTEWMTATDRDRYEELLDKAINMAHCIVLTEGAYWAPRTLSNFPSSLGPLNAPQQWPSYRINRNISVGAGTKTKQNGVYMPDVDNSCAEFLSTNYEKAPEACVLVGYRALFHPTTGEKYDEEPIFETRSCVWYLVERTAEHDSYTMRSIEASEELHRIRGGDVCPATGFYFTPARPGSRQLFNRGDLMPSFETEYGTTIWQWDSDQV